MIKMVRSVSHDHIILAYNWIPYSFTIHSLPFKDSAVKQKSPLMGNSMKREENMKFWRIFFLNYIFLNI